MMHQKNNLSPTTHWIQNSMLVKFFFIGLLILLLLIPNAMIMSLINEREGLHVQATNEVAEKWGQAQNITGPVLCVPYIRPAVDARSAATEGWAYILPDQLHINGNTAEEVRKRGIHRIVLYRGDLTLTGSFSLKDSPDFTGVQLQWERARVAVGISDLTGIREMTKLQWGAQSMQLQSGTGVGALLTNGVSTNILGLQPGQTDSFSINLSLKGSNYLGFEPLGRETIAKLKSTWPSPSFTGKFITDTSVITKDGFRAEWKILDLNRPYPQQWLDNAYHFENTSFGVNLMQTIDEYAKNTRTAKYAILVIGLTFMMFFFTEMIRNIRFHPLQYLLVGLALSMFYILLLSFSEHIGFNAAYGIAAAATIGLISSYAAAISKSRRLGIQLLLLLSTIFGFIFTILQMEDFALLAGSLGLFIALAAVMYFSRNIDWSNRSSPPEEELAE